MLRNDPLVPFYALVASAAASFAAWLYGRHLGPQPALSVGQIGLMAFGMLLLVYGVIGLASVWFEGRELRPGRRLPRRGVAPMVVGLVLSVVDAALAGIFVRLVVHGLATETSSPGPEGVAAGALFLCTAALLALYKRYFVEDEVTTDEQGSEVPW